MATTKSTKHNAKHNPSFIVKHKTTDRKIKLISELFDIRKECCFI